MIPRRLLSALGALALPLVAAAPASASELLNSTVTASSAVARDCHDRLLDAGTSGVASKRVTMPAAGLAGARLEAASGDWDVALFDVRTGRLVAGSAGFNAVEVAEGFVGGEREVAVQACRRSGSARSASLNVFSVAVPASDTKASLVSVQTPTQADKDLLTSLPVDVTEHGRGSSVDVVLYGQKDANTLRDAGLSYTVKVDDMVAQARRERAADRAFASANAGSSLPSGGTGYRRLVDYEAEMKALAAVNPNLVKPLTLNNPTLEGRQVQGIEITENARQSDGKPVFLQMGAHHAREWPSAEHAMEWAYEMVRGYGKNATITSLLRQARVIVVPVVNVDGFNLSREAPVDLVEDPEYQSLPALTDTAAYLADPAFAYKRRNCRVVDHAPAPGGICAAPAFRMNGVDPNRNYGGLWGGPGASAYPLYDTYRGPDPFSEPETQNIRELISGRQVTTLITNHTFSNLVLRPPGVRAQGPPPDEGVYKALGDGMAANNGYTSQPSYMLYDTTGTTEDWSYYATGGLGFTFEIGLNGFHPKFQEVVDHYRGAGALAGKGNRAAYMVALRSTADPARHSTLTGSAPAGSKLTLRKQFITETSPVQPLQTDVVEDIVEGSPTETETEKRYLKDTLTSTLTVGPSGTYRWSINPSTRPAVMEKRFPTVASEPSRSQDIASQEQTTPNQIAGEGEPGTYEDVPLTVTEADQTKLLRIDVKGNVPADDWDLELYRNDGGKWVEVGSSGNPANPEQILLDDPLPGDYRLRVVNFLAAGSWSGTVKWFRTGPDEVTPGRTEAWTLNCRRPDGTTVARKIEIARGQRLALNPCNA